jgi:membrane-bound ClpP family serine protease
MQNNKALETYKSETFVNTIFEALEESTGEDLTDVKETVKKVFGEKIAGTTENEEEESAPEETPVATVGVDLENAEIISPAGKLLTLTGKEALNYGLISKTVNSLEEAMDFFGYAEMRKVEIDPTLEEIIFAWLTSPTIAGLLLIGAEIFLIPGFGVAGISGIACLFAGVYLTLTKVAFPEYHWEFQRLEDAGQTMTTAIISSVVFGFLAWKLLPHTPFPGWLTLSTAQLEEAGYTVQTQAEEAQWIGQTGVTTSPLRPAGRGRFGDKTLDIVTRGEFLEKDTAVEIIEVKGNRLVVTAVEENQTP